MYDKDIIFNIEFKNYIYENEILYIPHCITSQTALKLHPISCEHSQSKPKMSVRDPISTRTCSLCFQFKSEV